MYTKLLNQDVNIIMGNGFQMHCRIVNSDSQALEVLCPQKKRRIVPTGTFLCIKHTARINFPTKIGNNHAFNLLTQNLHDHLGQTIRLFMRNGFQMVGTLDSYDSDGAIALSNLENEPYGTGALVPADAYLCFEF